jgi:hypothetical protein
MPAAVSWQSHGALSTSRYHCAVATGKKLAKQVRLDERAAIIRHKAEIERRNRNIVIAVFAVLIIGGSGGLYLLTNPPSWFQGSQATAHLAAYSVPDEGHNHITAGLPLGNKHEPPSSGNHYATPLAPGVYPVAQPSGNWVHSLEHGYIAVVYRCTGAECADLNSQAKAIMDSLPKDPKYNEVKFVSTPYQNMAPKIAILAWDKEQDADSMDAALITAFYHQYVNHGREDLP